MLSFQRCYFPLFQFVSSDLVLKSTLHKNIKSVIERACLYFFISFSNYCSCSILYAIIKNNHEHTFATIRTCLEAMMARKSWKDPTPNLMPSLQNTLDGLTVFRTLSTTFLQ